jgi:hypothetical protein
MLPAGAANAAELTEHLSNLRTEYQNLAAKAIADALNTAVAQLETELNQFRATTAAATLTAAFSAAVATSAQRHDTAVRELLAHAVQLQDLQLATIDSQFSAGAEARAAEQQAAQQRRQEQQQRQQQHSPRRRCPSPGHRND